MNRTFAYISTTVLLMATLLLAFGCRRHSEAWEMMESADRIMEECPDSALAILSDIDSTSLTGDEERARMALLMSMALDKNYIDTTDFSVLQPAIDYYPEHGTSNEKLRTLYYQGRIYQNQGNLDEAMKAFVRGNELREQVTDTLTLARMLVAQSFIFKYVYDLDKYSNNMLAAARLLEMKGRFKERSTCLIEAFEGYVLDENKIMADSIHSLCVKAVRDGELSEPDFIPYEIPYIEKYGTVEELRKLIVKATDTGSPNSDCILSMADGHVLLGETDKAVRLLENLEQSGIPYDTLRLDGIYYQLYDSIEDYHKALIRYEDFNNRYYFTLEKMLNLRLQSSEDRHLSEIREQKEASTRKQYRWFAIAGVCLFLTILIILLLVIRSHRISRELAKQREKSFSLEVKMLRTKMSELLDERDSLANVIGTYPGIPLEVQNAARKRIETLNLLLVNEITDDSKHISKSRELIKALLSDKLTFMNETRLAFSASHPDFIRHLEEHGLTENEINYVCLYAIGLNGRETGSYLEKGGHINMSSAIRKKLGIGPHDTNLSIYIRQLLTNYKG